MSLKFERIIMRFVLYCTTTETICSDNNMSLYLKWDVLLRRFGKWVGDGCLSDLEFSVEEVEPEINVCGLLQEEVQQENLPIRDDGESDPGMNVPL
ncbi:hypothetical protein JTB14_000336 [Gonioctena quinquepunctata]|nr:hypothetical protein JTB14_000336 [Gonioctena quinquepunctata]